jgi:4'-phosphopantetheinyl transferase
MDAKGVVGDVFRFIGFSGRRGEDRRMSDRSPARETIEDQGSEPIRVWWTDLDRPECETASLATILSADERARADRFRFDRDRQRFTVARGLLRVLIGRTLGVPAGEVIFAYGKRGKPALRWPADSGLEFNLSHSHGLALYATTWKRAIGIDLEFQRNEFDYHGIAGRFFTAREFDQIQALPDGARRAAFFRGWARKEAFLKARGDGLWLGLDQFEVSIDPESPARLVRTSWDPDESGRWSLHDLDVASGFAAALAVAGVITGPIVVDQL